MARFMDEDFLLDTRAASRLYHGYAQELPIYDFHCHLPVAHIAADHGFRSLTEAWLGGDHYKWRAMRASGLAERLVTGDASDLEKFEAWAGAGIVSQEKPDAWELEHVIVDCLELVREGIHAGH